MGCHHNSLDAATTGSRGFSPRRDPEDPREEQMVVGVTVEPRDRAEVDASLDAHQGLGYGRLRSTDTIGPREMSRHLAGSTMVSQEEVRKL